MKKYILNHKFLLSLSLIFVIVISIVEAYQAILFKTIVDTAAGTYSYEISTLILFSILFLAAVFLSETLSKASNAALNAAVMRDYKQSIIKSFLNIDTQSKLSSSELISILNNDIKVIEDNYLNSIINIAKDIFLFIVSLYLLLRINIYLTLAIIIFGWLPVVIPQLFNKRNQALKGKYLENLERHVNHVKEIAQGFELIKGFNIEDKIFNIFSGINKETEHSKFKSDSFMGFQGAISLVSGFSIFFINIIIATVFVMRGDITIGAMIAAVQLMNYIVNPLISISMYVTKIKSVSKVITNIQERILNKSNSNQGEKEFSFHNKLEIEDLSYSYDNREEVISNINYVFEKGKKYAIVGESGCGKSTLLKILMNQIDNYQGKIKIDDNDIKSFDPSSYYNKVTLIQQNVFMFKDTIKNNICLYNDFPEKKFNKVIKQSGLLKTISLHEKGIDTIVGEGKVQLSGGELNRIAIARALIKDAEILLVDEATSALDKVTAYEIEKTLTNLDKTLIAITHQMDETILDKYDEILVMKDGKIVESGNFKQLLDNESHFYFMYNSKMHDNEIPINFTKEALDFL